MRGRGSRERTHRIRHLRVGVRSLELGVDVFQRLTHLIAQRHQLLPAGRLLSLRDLRLAGFTRLGRQILQGAAQLVELRELGGGGVEDLLLRAVNRPLASLLLLLVELRVEQSRRRGVSTREVHIPTAQRSVLGECKRARQKRSRPSQNADATVKCRCVTVKNRSGRALAGSPSPGTAGLPDRSCCHSKRCRGGALAPSFEQPATMRIAWQLVRGGGAKSRRTPRCRSNAAAKVQRLQESMSPST